MLLTEVIKTAIEGVVIIEPKVFKDDSLGIDCKIPTENALLSEKDMKHELLMDFDSPFVYGEEIYPEFLID